MALSIAGCAEGEGAFATGPAESTDDALAEIATQDQPPPLDDGEAAEFAEIGTPDPPAAVAADADATTPPALSAEAARALAAEARPRPSDEGLPDAAPSAEAGVAPMPAEDASPPPPDPIDPALYAGPFEGPIDDRLLTAPDLFEARETVRWDGTRTLAGIWIAHPRAARPERVRIVNLSNGLAADGAVFSRDRAGPEAPVQISSEAATTLGMRPMTEADLVVVGLRQPDALPERSEPDTETGFVAEAVAEDGADAGGMQPLDLPAGTGEPPALLAESLPPPSAAGASEPEPVEAAPAAEPARDPAAAIIIVGKPDRPRTVLPSDTAPISPGTAKPARAEPGPRVTARSAGTGTDTKTATAVTAARQTGGTGTAGRLEAPSQPPEPKQQAEKPSADGFYWEEKPTKAKPAAARPAPAMPAPSDTRAAARTAAADPASAAAGDGNARAPETETPSASPPRPAASPAEGATLAQPYIQVGIFGVPENVRRLTSQLTAGGIPARAIPLQQNGRELSRVVAGPFGSEAERDRAMSVIRGLGIRDARPSGN